MRRGPTSSRRRRRPTIHPSPISSRSAGNRWPAWHSRSRPPAATTCCSSVRQAPARRCSRNGFPDCSRRSSGRSRSRRRWCTRRPECRSRRVGSSGGRRSDHRTTRAPSSRSSVVVRARCGRARSASLTVASCSWTSSVSSRSASSTPSASRSRRCHQRCPGQCACRAPARFLLVAATNPARAAVVPGGVRVRRGTRQRYSGVSRDRCSTGSICGSQSSVQTSMNCSPARAASHRRRSPPGSKRHDASPVNEGRAQAECRAPARPVRAVTAPAGRLLRHELERQRLTGRGYHRIRRVARTLADLELEPPELVDDAMSSSRSRCARGWLLRSPTGGSRDRRTRWWLRGSLAGFRGMTPRRLRVLLDHLPPRDGSRSPGRGGAHAGRRPPAHRRTARVVAPERRRAVAGRVLGAVH